MANPIYHVSAVGDWRAARAAGEYAMSSNGSTLAEVGFIHCCYSTQLPGVLQRFYGDVTEPLCLLAIDPDRLAVPVVAENLDGGEELFPHIYGPIPITAVTEVSTLTRDEDTGWRFDGG